MNIYNFINSKDVRSYAQKIGYQFSAPEAAYLVHQSDGKTLQEKMQAWQEIIDTMPDCPIEKRNWLEAAESSIPCCLITWICSGASFIPFTAEKDMCTVILFANAFPVTE